MSKTNQKTAVYNAVKSVVSFEDNDVVQLTKDEKSTVVSILVAGFEADEIELKNPQTDLKKYCGGLLNNWLRKDTRMNGGSAYVTKNPGSRAGSGDAMIKNLKLLKQKEGLTTEEIAKIDQAIADRLAIIKPKVEKKVDFNEIPAELLASLGLEIE